MVVFSRLRISIVSIVCMLGVLFALPNVLPNTMRAALPGWMRKTVNLGLDLQGGSHLQLQVDIHSVTKEHLNNILNETRKKLRSKQIKYTNLHLTTNPTSITFKLLNPADANTAIKLMKGIDKDLSFSDVTNGMVVATLTDNAIREKNHGIVDQSIEVVRRRIDATGTKEPVIQRQGDDRIIVQLPGVSDPSEIRRLLGTTARLSFQWVDDSVQPIVEAKGAKVYLPAPPVGSVYMPEERPDGTNIYVAIKKPIIIRGDTLVDARATYNEHGQPVVSIKFNNIGSQQMYEASKQIKKQFAIVLDNKVISAPVFQDTIQNGNAQISGRFTVDEATELALLLRAGALPAPLKVIEESTVGPSLGADSIAYGKRATVIAFLIIAVFMVLVYSSLGIFADIALFMNVILLFAGLSLLGATLTLPGIVGIALTIGMAVDANVLIFERIKEELRSGIRMMSAIDCGYRRAFSAILDSNLTTLLGAGFLYYFGTGPVKGFSVTLILGVVISLFTALTLTQMLMVSWLRFRKIQKLPI